MLTLWIMTSRSRLGRRSNTAHNKRLPPSLPAVAAENPAVGAQELVKTLSVRGSGAEIGFRRRVGSLETLCASAAVDNESRGITVTEVGFTIGKRSSDFLAVQVQRRSHPQATDFWDGNWLAARVEVGAGRFHGTFGADFRTTEFREFEAALSRLHRLLEGDAAFETMEQQVKILVRGDGLGHFEARCTVLDEPGIGNRLEFVLSFDQTEIPEIVRGLSSVSEAFPTRGQPVG